MTPNEQEGLKSSYQRYYADAAKALADGDTREFARANGVLHGIFLGAYYCGAPPELLHWMNNLASRDPSEQPLTLEASS